MKFILPCLILWLLIICLIRRVPIYKTFISGVEDGLGFAKNMLPPMIAVLSASAMLRQSGILDMLSDYISPILTFIGFPKEIIPVAILKPLSGSGSMGLFSDIVREYGPDSYIANCAASICAASETTFYVLSVYLAPTRITQTKQLLFIALIGDFVGILASVLLCKIFF